MRGRAFGRSLVGWRQGWARVAVAAVSLAGGSGCAPDFGSLSSGPAIGGDSGAAGAESVGGSGGAAGGSGGAAGSADLGGTTGDGADAGGSPLAGNLIVNGSFDDGPSRWIAVGNPMLTLSSSTAHSPERCLWASNRTQTWEGPGYPLNGIVEPGRQYVVSLWARAEEGSMTANVTLKVRCPDDTTEGTFTPLTYVTLTTDWSEVTGFFTAATCGPLESLVYVEAAPASGNFYIDDTRIELVP